MTIDISERVVEKTFSKKAKVIIHDEVNCMVVGLQPDHHLYFYEEYGIFAENYFFTPRYKIGAWDGKLRYFTKDGHTYVLLLDEIIKKVVKFGYKITIDDRRINGYCDVPPIDENYLSGFINPKTNEPYAVRPYQIGALNSVFDEGFGIIIAGTGAGKTTINTILVDHYEKLHGLRSITIVPSISLIGQTVATFEEFGLDVGRYDGEVKDLKHQHIVSTWQALQNYPQLMRMFQVVVVDECLDKNTQIQMGDGTTKPIYLVSPGEKVVTFNECTKEFEPGVVVKRHENLNSSASEKMYELEFDDGTSIHVTGNHKIMTSIGYIRADELTEDHEIITLTNRDP